MKTFDEFIAEEEIRTCRSQEQYEIDYFRKAWEACLKAQTESVAEVPCSVGLGGANLKEDKKMDIPGITAKHKIVTQDCRKRPIEEIKAETVDELWQTFEELNETWPKDADVKFRFVLLVER